MDETPSQRRQREAAQRMVQAMMPDVQRVMRDMVRQQTHVTRIGEVLSSQYTDMLKSISASAVLKFDAPLIRASRVDLARLNVPALRLDYQSLFPNLAAIHADALKSLLPSITLVQDLQREQFAGIIAKARAAMLARLPPNWRGDEVSVPGNLEQLLLDEGLPLAWVPPRAVVVKIFAAKTPAERRRIIGDRWKSITKACLQELQAIEHAGLAEPVEFAIEAAESLLEGRAKSSQALAANLLDSILRAEFSDDDRRTITGQSVRLSIDDYPLRVAIVFGGIWGSYGQYWPQRGDRIPRNYSRHGSAHGVSRRQYSRVNAGLALMHVVALLKVMEADLANW